MNIGLWVLQILLGLFFLYNGYTHFSLPPNLPAQMAWMYDLPPALHYLAGTAELLAGLGLILPGLARVQTRLTWLAAAGLVLVMLGAAAWHIPRGEVANSGMNLVVAGLAGFVAFGRWKLAPIKDRRTA